MGALVLSLLLLVPPGPALLPARPTLSLGTGGLKGLVQDVKGQPVPGAQVRLLGLDGRRWVATTDAQGAFKAGELPPGEYRVELSKGKQAAVASGDVLIKPNAWLLGVPPAAPGAHAPRLRLVGPATYTSPGPLITPVTRPKTEQIPMH